MTDAWTNSYNNEMLIYLTALRQQRQVPVKASSIDSNLTQLTTKSKMHIEEKQQIFIGFKNIKGTDCRIHEHLSVVQES